MKYGKDNFNEIYNIASTSASILINRFESDNILGSDIDKVIKVLVWSADELGHVISDIYVGFAIFDMLVDNMIDVTSQIEYMCNKKYHKPEVSDADYINSMMLLLNSYIELLSVTKMCDDII